MSTPRPVLVIAGLGTSGGTGAAVAKYFAKNNFAVALLARGQDAVSKLEDEINQSGGQAAGFTLPAYDAASIRGAFASIRSKYPSPEYSIRAAVYNAGNPVWKPFLEVTEADIEATINVDIKASFAFSREVISDFKNNDLGPNGDRGTLIFTGATASLRGNKTTSAFAAGKFALRALSQSLSKEFGKDNIHVAHAIIDGRILTERAKSFFNDPEWEKNENARLDPESIAKSYLYLVNQDRSTWTWELDLRPAHENW